MANKISKELGKCVIESWGAMSTLYQILGKFGIKLQQLNKMIYKRTPRYSPDPISLWKLVYKQLVKTAQWEQGVNEKTFLANQPLLDNQIVGWEHSGNKQTSRGSMFNMILNNGTRSDNPMIDVYGRVWQSYDYFLPKSKKITKVTIYYNQIIGGFRFHLSDGSNWDIGCVGGITKTVDIADNEVIVGFKAKSHPDCPAWYVEW